MPTEAELQAENARLRDELNAARRAPQAGAVDAGVVRGEQAATERWQQWDQRVKQLNKEAADLWAEGRFEEAQTKQSEMATAALHRESAAQAYGQWNQLRGSPLVEQFLASRPGVYNAEEQAWIRRHPSYSVDPAFQSRIAAEYNAAQAEGFRPGSAALVASGQILTNDTRTQLSSCPRKRAPRASRHCVCGPGPPLPRGRRKKRSWEPCVWFIPLGWIGLRRAWA